MAMSIEQLRALAERLEKAKGSDMDLDGALYHLHPTLAGVRGYTSSIDAALALVERLLPGWAYQISGGILSGLASVRMGFDDGWQVYKEANTPALAILRALVAVLIAQAGAQ